MRAAEARARADEIKETEPKAIMFRIASDYAVTLSQAGTTRSLHRGAARVLKLFFQSSV